MTERRYAPNTERCKLCHDTGWFLYKKFIPELNGEYEFGTKCICRLPREEREEFERRGGFDALL